MIGVLSSARIPYCGGDVALRRIRPDVFSILMSLESAAAALVGDGRARGVPQAASSGRGRHGDGGERRATREPLSRPQRDWCSGPHRFSGRVGVVFGPCQAGPARMPSTRPPAGGWSRWSIPLHPQRRRTRLRAWTNDTAGRIEVRRCCSERPRRQPLDLVGAAARRLRRPRRLLEPPWDGRLARPTDPAPGRHRGTRRGHRVGHGPLPHRPGRWSGRSIGVNTASRWPSVTRSGSRHRGGRRRPRRHVRHHAGAATPAARTSPATDGEPVAGVRS